ncbi:MAG TPA: G1 family glutamic endopeptidase [Rugosimonospora sp.]|nr:G1 family glutamic endopeptidase [Rugosimonospora sp.]
MNHVLRRMVTATAVGLLGLAGAGLAAVAPAAAAPARVPAQIDPNQPHSGLPKVAPRGLTPPTGASCTIASTTTPTTSNCWSGYVQQAGGYNTISASWTVPTANPATVNSNSFTWIGIDGWNSANLIQTGTAQTWNASTNSASYHAWWEILPASETPVFNVSPGDAITASISRVSGTQWSILLQDHTNGQTISTTQTYTGPGASAEFIHEAPTQGGNVVPLTPFSTFSFYDARVNGNSPALNANQRVTMVQNSATVSSISTPNEAANGFSVANSATAPAAPPTPVFQLHSDGTIWASTGAGCSGSSCPGWFLLDNNPATVQIAAGAGSVFQRHSDGSIWEWTGTPCSTGCPGWALLDNNRATTSISAGSGTVFQLHSDGSIWRSTGVPCNTSCPGWTELDNNPAAKAIAAGAGTVFQLHTDGSIWRSTGVACSGASCPGWTELDNNPAGVGIVASSSTVYQLHSDGSIWRSTGTACSGASCPGWTELDNNPAARAISVSNGS